ncbi:rhomboid family intramembrane serine protease [Chloroflexota bacterium]
MTYRNISQFRLNPVWFLIIINLASFVARMINPDLIYVLGLSWQNFWSSPWTLITSMFVHAGLWHIIFNMWTLYFFGTSLARLVGWGRFLIVYFCGGILGGIFYVLLSSPYSLAIGASGAIFALGGALAVMRPNIKVIIFPIPLPISLWIAVIGGFIILTLLSVSMAIAWQAHLGGMVFGLIAGYFFRRRERSLASFSGYGRY